MTPLWSCITFSFNKNKEVNCLFCRLVPLLMKLHLQSQEKGKREVMFGLESPGFYELKRIDVGKVLQPHYVFFD